MDAWLGRFVTLTDGETGPVTRVNRLFGFDGYGRPVWVEVDPGDGTRVAGYVKTWG